MVTEVLWRGAYDFEITSPRSGRWASSGRLVRWGPCL